MQRLHVSQPSLSRHIRDLEEEIGVKLLERTSKSVRLTDAGRAFLDEARAILKHTDDAVGKCALSPAKARQSCMSAIGRYRRRGSRPSSFKPIKKRCELWRANLHDWPVEKNIVGVRDGRLQLAIILPPLKATC